MIQYFFNVALLGFCWLTIQTRPVEAVCYDIYAGRVVTAAGDWTSPQWNANNPDGKMTFNDLECSYNLIINGLKSNFKYDWKVKCFISLISKLFNSNILLNNTDSYR
jgi:hypothetical protein